MEFLGRHLEFSDKSRECHLQVSKYKGEKKGTIYCNEYRREIGWMKYN
jgi:hypothetical protein